MVDRSLLFSLRLIGFQTTMKWNGSHLTSIVKQMRNYSVGIVHTNDTILKGEDGSDSYCLSLEL